ncbi:MAG: VOC family protein [Deltaproteobacteria bacterium]|nr:VOC family protein [Deltaproteobacteria bacterium]
MTPIKITELDHIVLSVRDVDRSLTFYTQVLGLKGERVREFKEGKVGFPSVRINDHTIIDLSPLKGAKSSRRKSGDKSQGNLNHFCLVVERENFSGTLDYLKRQCVPIRQGPISRWGARGRASSVYFLDPDGNEIEIRSY